MKLVKACLPYFIGIICCCNTPDKESNGAKRTVEVQHDKGRFTLLRHGIPYVIKGVCVLNEKYLLQAKERGANSVRTYDTENAMKLLDSAGRLGLTVTLGLKLPYAGVDFDYRDDKAVSLQVEQVRQQVLKYKDHPALLMWGIGNELSLYLKRSSIPSQMALLRAIERIARMVHQVDPNHPTTTTLPSTRTSTIAAVDLFCGNIDIISLNSFEQLSGLPERSAKYSKPYIISEYGATGYWRTTLTDWYSHIEQTSGEKSAFIIEQSSVIKSDTGRCLGSYAFIWGHKLEYTTTWFSLFTEGGKATEVVDALQYGWTGTWPSKRSPAIYSIKINKRESADNIYLVPGKEFATSITTDTGNIKNLFVTAGLYKDDLEAAELFSQANYNQKPNPDLLPDSFIPAIVYDSVIENGSLRSRLNITVKAPLAKGAYRVFIYLHDRYNRVATANACFYVHD